MSSSDGGAMWTSVASATIPAQTLHAVRAHDDGRTVWIVGAAGTILRTNDGGATWASKAQSPSQGQVPFQNNFDVKLLSADEAWVAGSFGTLMHTTDGGDTWEDAALGTASALYSVHFSGSCGWAVGSDGVLMHTTDAGAEWTLQQSCQGASSNARYSLFDVAFDASGRFGWAVGEEGVVCYTRNAGLLWETQSVDQDVLGIELRAISLQGSGIVALPSLQDKRIF